MNDHLKEGSWNAFVARACRPPHGKTPGRIDMEDGRILAIVNTDAQVVWQALEQK